MPVSLWKQFESKSGFLGRTTPGKRKRIRKALNQRNLRAELLEDRRMLACDISWISPTAGQWDTAENWDMNRVPVATDQVCIQGEGLGTAILENTEVTVDTLTVGDGELLALRYATLNANLEQLGSIFARGISRINGTVTTATTSITTVQGDAGNNGILTVDQGFTNQGQIQLYTQSVTGAGVGLPGSGAKLIVESGSLTNEGAIRALTPNHSAAPKYVLEAELINHGVVSIDETALPDRQNQLTLTRAGANHVNSGSIFVAGGSMFVTEANLDNSGTIEIQPAHKLDLHTVHLVHSGSSPVGGGTVRIYGLSPANPAVLELNSSLSTAGIALSAQYAIVDGTETLMNAEGGSMTMIGVTVNTPVNNQGFLRASGPNRFTSTLATGIDSTLFVEGNAQHANGRLTIANGFTNEGRIQLYSRSISGAGVGQPGHRSYLEIENGTLVNNGTIQTLKPGHAVGTDYRLLAQLDNRGTLTVELDEDTPELHDLILFKEGAVHRNSGSIQLIGGNLQIDNASLVSSGDIQILPNRNLVISSNSASPVGFTHDDGTLSGGGEFHLQGARHFVANPAVLQLNAPLDNSGSNLRLDDVHVLGTHPLTSVPDHFILGSSLVVETPLVIQGDLGLQGRNQLNGLLTTASTSQIYLVGTQQNYNAETTVAASFVNRGLLSLYTASVYTGAFTRPGRGAKLTVADGQLVNEGTIQTVVPGHADASADYRIEAELDNRGTLTTARDAEFPGRLTPLIIDRAGAQHESSGTFDLQGGDVSIPANQAFENLGVIHIAESRKLDLQSSFLHSSGQTVVAGEMRVTGAAELAGGEIRATSLAINNLKHTGGTLGIGSPFGKLDLGGNYEQGPNAILNFQIGGVTPQDFDQLHIFGDATLTGSLNVSYANGFVAEPGHRFPIIESSGSLTTDFDSQNATDLGLGIEQSATELTLIGQEAPAALVFDLSPVAVVRVGDVEFLPDGISGGTVAELHNIRVDLLPDENKQSWASFIVEQALGLDTDSNTTTVEGFTIAPDNVDGTNDGLQFDLQRLVTDLSRADFVGSAIIEQAKLVLKNFSGFLDGAVSGGIELSADAFTALLNKTSEVSSVIRTIRDQASELPVLAGDLDLANAVFRLTADVFEVDPGTAFSLSGTGATIVVGQPALMTEPILSVDTATLGLSLPGVANVSIVATDLKVDLDRGITVGSAAGTFQAQELTQTLAGVLPFQVTELELAATVTGPISLDNFEGSLKVDGYFDENFLPTGLPVTPKMQIGGNHRETGSDNAFESEFRLIDGAFRPRNFGPISLGIESLPISGLELDGELQLGGYQNGVWNQDLGGYLRVVRNADGSQSLDPFLDLRFDILPQGSSLSFGKDVFAEPSSLSVMGKVALDANFQGTIGGVDLRGATLGLQFDLDVTPLVETPFFKVTASTEIGELSFEEIAIEVNHLGTLTASVILFDLADDPDPNEPIGHVGKIEFQPSDNGLFTGLDRGLVEIFDVEMYHNRLQLGIVNIAMDGVIAAEDGMGGTVDLLLVDDLRLLFHEIVIESPEDGPQFSDLLDPNFVLSNPFLDDIGFQSLDVAVDAAIVLPESTNPDVVPNVACDAAGHVLGDLSNDVAGVAAIACIRGTWTSAGLSLTADTMRAALFDTVEIDASGVAINIRPDQTVDATWLNVATATASLSLLDDAIAVDLTANDVQVTRQGVVSLASAVAQAGQGQDFDTFKLQDFLPVAIERVEVKPLQGDARVFLNRDTNNDGIPAPEFDVAVAGTFNTDPFENFGLSTDVTVGSGPVASFSATFRVQEYEGRTIIAPWDTGLIQLGLRVDLDDSHAGLVFDGDLTLGGYTDGQWISDLAGTLATGARLIDDAGNTRADLAIDLRPGSSLSNNNLTILAKAQFSAGTTGTYAGISLDNLTLGFNISLDWQAIDQSPYMYVTDFSIQAGEVVTIENFKIDIHNLVELTIDQIDIRPQPGPGEGFATITSATATFKNSYFNGMNTYRLTVSGTDVFSDRISIGTIRIDLDGLLTVGTVDLLEFDEFIVKLTGLEIGGDFSSVNLDNRTVPVNENTDLLSGSLSDISIESKFTTLLPGSDVSASISNLEGGIDIASGTVTLDAAKITGKIFDVFSFDSDPVTLTAGPAVAATTPFLEVTGQTTLSVTLLDERPIELITNDFQISQSGVVSITSAGTNADQGLARSLGLAEGLLPFDVTLIELAAPPGERLALSDRAINANVTVNGFFDFTIFESLPFTPVLSIGNQSSDPATDRDDPANAFHLEFNVKASTTELPTVQLVNTGSLTLGVKDFQLGPFQLHAASTNGNDFASEPATITLGGYENGVWNGSIDADVGIGWNGIAGDGSENSPVAIDAVAGVIAKGEVVRISETRTQLTFDAQIVGSLGLGNLPLEGGLPDERGFGFRFRDLEFDWDVQFVVRADDNGFHIERVGNNPYIDFNGLSVDNVNLDFGGLVQMNAEHAKLDFDVFARDSAGNILTSGPFLIFGDEDGTPDQRPNSNIISQADLDTVDGSIEVTVGGGSLPGLGGRAGNFGIGWNQANVQLDPLDPKFSLGVDFYQLPGFFVSIVQPQSSNEGGKTFNFGLDWFPVNVDEIGLRFNDIIDQVPGVDADELLTIFPGGSSSNRDDEPGLIERTTSYAMNLLKDVELLFSGGFDSGRLPLIGDLIGFSGDIQNVRVDVGAMKSCAEHVWAELIDPNSQIAQEVKDLAFEVVDGEIREFPGGRLLAMAALGFSELASLGNGTCVIPLKGFDSIGGGGGFDFGPLDVSLGIGFGALSFDRNGDPSDGNEAQALFLRGEGNFSAYDIGLGGEIILTEYGPVLAKLLTGVPIPIGTMVGGLAGTGVFPGVGTGIGAGAGTASGFMITGTRGGIVFDGEPLPIIQDPIELVENFEITAPLEMGNDQIKSAVEKLFRGPNNEVLETPRYVWDQGFSIALSGVLTNALIANNVGLNVTLGLNVGYQLPDYRLAQADDANTMAKTVLQAIRDRDPLSLPGSFAELGETELQTAVTVFDAAYDAAIAAGDGDEQATQLGQAAFREFMEAYLLSIPDPVGSPPARDFNALEFVKNFPFGMQLYGLADLEVFGFPIGRAGAMLDYSDPINPVFNIAAQAPPEGSFLQSLFPVEADVGLQLDSSGLVEGSLIATQSFLQNVFNRSVEIGQEYFNALMVALATKLNIDMLAMDANYAGMQLTQILLDGLTPPAVIDSDFLRDRLLGGGVNDLPGIFDLDLTAINLSNAGALQAANAAGELLREILTLGPEFVNSFSLDAIEDDEWFDILAGRARDAILNPFSGLASILAGDSANTALQRFRDAVDSGAAPDPITDPVVYELWLGYQNNIKLAKAQVAFTKAFGQTLWNAGETASQLFFDTIDPSFLLKGQIQPTLLGMPLSDLGIQIPGIDRVEESFEIIVDKRGVSMDADVQVLEKLLRISGLPLPLYDQLKLGVQIPTENLLRDVILSQPPVIDPTRDWRGTFQGTVGFGSGIYGFDLGDITGLVFPAVAADFDANDPRVGIPDDHPLMTHVRIVTDLPGEFVDQPRFGQDGDVDDRVLVTEEDFATMRRRGGILFDGRLTLPQFITDPLTWFNKLKEDVDTNLSICRSHDNLLSCFQALETPDQYLQFFTALKDAPLTVANGVLAEQQIAQVQAFVPNVYQEIVPLLSEVGAGAVQNLQSQIYDVFERLTDGFDIDQDISALLAAGILAGPDPGVDQATHEANIRQLFESLLHRLSNESYLHGDIGTSSRILGIDFGGGILNVDNGVLTATGFLPGGEPFNALIEVAREPAETSYPKAGMSIDIGRSLGGFDLENLPTLLSESGIEDIPLIGPTIGAFADIGDWLNSGIPVGEVNAQFFAYTPGFDPDADDTPRGRIQRSGGVGVTSDVTLSNSFGSIDGELEFSLASDVNSPTGVTFSGLFHVAAGTRFSLPDPISGSHRSFTLASANVVGKVRPSGCIEVQLDPTLLNINLSGPVNLRYALASGACNAAVTLANIEAVEPAGTAQQTVQVPVRLGQVPLDWDSGEVTLKYQVLGSAEYGNDFAIRESTGGFIPASNSSWRTGQVTFTRFDVQTSSSGELFAERYIEVVLLGDGSMLGPAEGNKQIRLEFYPPINTADFEVTLDDRLVTISIIDGDFVFPPKPTNAAVLFDFQENDTPTNQPDPDSTLVAVNSVSGLQWNRQSVFSLTYGEGLPENSELDSTGLALRRPGPPFKHPLGYVDGYEFDVNVDSLFTPSHLEFWDRTSEIYGRNTEWEVWAIVNSNAPVQIPNREILTVDQLSLPQSHPDLQGWRKIRAEFGNTLRQPVPASGALLPGPWPYFNGDTQLTIRLVPVVTGRGKGTPANAIDNVALFGGTKQRGGSFAGTNLSFDEFVNGRVEFAVSGPGIVDVSFTAPPDGADPAPFDNMAPTINVLGGDPTTEVKITVSGRSPDAPALNLGSGRILSRLAKFDLSEAGEVRGRFTSIAPIGVLHVDSMSDGSYFLIDGSPTDEMTFIADGVVGDGTADGFILDFPGKLYPEVAGWDRGALQAGALGAAVSHGTFSPNIALQHGFDSIAVEGSFESSWLQTGLAPGTNNGSSGPISVTNGNINVTSARFDGNLGLLQASGGSIHFDTLEARYAAGAKANSNNTSPHLTNISGNYSVLGIGTVETFGGDISASIVATDGDAPSVQFIAIPDNRGFGGGLYSPNSIHIAGSVDAIVAKHVDLNLIVGGRVESIFVAEDNVGSLAGHFRAASFGEIVVRGDASFSIETTALAATLPTQSAVKAIRIAGGDLRGGALRLQPNTQIEEISVTSIDGRGGNLVGWLRANGDVGQLSIEQVDARIEIDGNLTNFQSELLNDTLLVSGLHFGTIDIASTESEGRHIIEGIPGGVEPGGLILGLLFNDQNNNAIHDPGETLTEEHIIHLVDENDNVVASTTTHWRDLNHNGILDIETEANAYAFNNVPNGQYHIIPILPDDWRQTTELNTHNLQSAQEIMEVVGIRLHTPWHNSLLPYDVNADGIVTPIDALLIINYLNSTSSRVVPNTDPTSGYVDVSRDNFITPIDVLLVVNELNRDSGEGETRYSLPSVTLNANLPRLCKMPARSNDRTTEDRESTIPAHASNWELSRRLTTAKIHASPGAESVDFIIEHVPDLSGPDEALDQLLELLTYNADAS